MSDHQNSGLVDSAVCRACARCCSSYRIALPEHGGIETRIGWLDTEVVTVKRSDILVGDTPILFVDFNIPCKQLEKVGGIFSCRVWDRPEKPGLCRTFPTSLFVDFERKTLINDPELVRKLIDANKDICPILKKLTIEDVIREQKAQVERILG